MVAYVDDGYIKAKFSVTLQVLTDLKDVFKEDDGLDLNVPKTTFLPKGIISLTSFVPEVFLGIGVPISGLSRILAAPSNSFFGSGSSHHVRTSSSVYGLTWSRSEVPA